MELQRKKNSLMRKIKDSKKFTCLNDKEKKVAGAIIGAKKDVLAWMKETFPGIRKPTERDMVSAFEFFYEGEIEAYETSDGKNLYLAEVISENNTETQKEATNKKPAAKKSNTGRYKK